MGASAICLSLGRYVRGATASCVVWSDGSNRHHWPRVRRLESRRNRRSPERPALLLRLGRFGLLLAGLVLGLLGAQGLHARVLAVLEVLRGRLALGLRLGAVNLDNA